MKAKMPVKEVKEAKDEELSSSQAPVEAFPEKQPTKKFTITLDASHVMADDTEEARTLYDQSRYGEPKDNKFLYSLTEGLFLLEKGRVDVIDEDDKKIDPDQYQKRAKKIEPSFWVRYSVYKDLRNRGYIVKTALKFGADFRVYDRGVKPGEDHARWVVFPVHESGAFTWYEFSAKNRVAHSTRKRLLLAIVDDEGDVTYYEVGWKRP